MAQVTDGEDCTQPLVKHRQTHDSLWLWLALIGGSIAAHGLLAIIVLPFTPRLSPEAQPSAYTSISLVELPDETAQVPAQVPAKISAKAPAASAGIAPTAPSRSLSPARAVQPAPATEGGTIGLAPAPTPKTESSSPAQPPVMPSLPALSPIARPAPSPAPAAPVAAAASPATPIAPAPTAASPIVPAAPTASPTPPSPRLATEPITVPVPQVSESLPVPAASPLPQVAVSAQVAPPHLTANLKFDHLPPTEVGVLPESLAVPKNGVAQQTFTDATSSVCLGLVTPEAGEFLGKTVALQVATNVKGQVTNTKVRRSSQNSAYDKLAQCIVTHWEFEPARVKNLPVPSNALLVQVTLEQN